MFKSIYLVTVLLTVCCSLHAQLTEMETSGSAWKLYGQVKYVGPAKASLEYIAHTNDTTFLLMMWDARPELKTYFSIKFSSRGNTLQHLYDILVSFFEKENWKNKDYIKVFTLGAEKVSVYKSFVLGTKSILLKTDKGRIELSKGEIEKLFSK